MGISSGNCSGNTNIDLRLFPEDWGGGFWKTLQIVLIPHFSCLQGTKGLTKAGRALDKHGNRPGSVFPKPTGNVEARNIQGQMQLDQILNDANHIIIKDERIGNFQIYSEDGRGAYFREYGSFRGFIERQYE